MIYARGRIPLGDFLDDNIAAFPCVHDEAAAGD